MPGSLISNSKAVAIEGGTAGHTMTPLGESSQEAQRLTRSLATPKSTMRVGCTQLDKSGPSSAGGGMLQTWA